MSKKIASLVLAFILAVSLVVPAVAYNVAKPLTEYDYWVDSAEQADYFNKLKNYVEDYLGKTYAPPSGVTVETFKDLISLDEVKQFFSAQLKAALASGTYRESEADSAVFKKTLKDRYDDYAAELGTELTPEQDAAQKEAIDYVVDLCVADYVAHGKLQYLMLAERYVVSYRSALLTASSVCLCLALACVLTLLISLKKKSIGYFAYALGGASLLGFLPEIYLRMIGFYSTFGFDPPYMLDLFFALESGVMKRIMLCATVFAVLSVILVVTDVILNKDKKAE